MIYFATSNVNKFREAEEILRAFKIKVVHFPFKYNEIRSDNLEEIAKDAVNVAYRKLKKPVFVEDSGLFIATLNDFPGTYSAWTMNKIGNRGILSLMKGKKNRVAYFKAGVAYSDGEKITTFNGEIKGKIADRPKGNNGFGFDPVFIPERHEKTFAQDADIKNKLSHRKHALLKLAEFLRRNEEK